VIYQIVFRNLTHRPTRTFLTVAAIAVEICLILLIWGTAEGLVQEANRRKAGTGADILIRPPTSSTSSRGAGLSSGLIDEIQALAGVELAVGAIVQMQSDTNTITGVEMEKFTRMAGGLDYLEGESPKGRFDVVVDEVYAKHKKVTVGESLRLLNRDFNVVGIVETGKLSRIFVPLKTMQELTGDLGQLSQIYVKLTDSDQTQAMIAKEFIAVVVGVAISVGFIVVLLAMYTAVLDRIREIGILKSLGASPFYIVRIFLQEAIILTAAGVLVGIVLAYGAQFLIRSSFPLVMMEFLESHIVWAAAISFIGSIMGTIYPAHRAASLDAIDALA
jgi:putative ABC transport system permease protein